MQTHTISQMAAGPALSACSSVQTLAGLTRGTVVLLQNLLNCFVPDEIRLYACEAPLAVSVCVKAYSQLRMFPTKDPIPVFVDHLNASYLGIAAQYVPHKAAFA